MIKTTETTIASTDRLVVIVCKSEKKLREHKFARMQSTAGQTLLLFSCCVCDEERVYGAEN